MAFETEIIKNILRDPSEDRGVEFKGPGEWGQLKDKLARTCLAMANLHSDGYIIVGVEEKSDNGFELVGLDAVQLNSFNVDDVKDRLANYLDPPVDICCQPVNLAGKDYFVIKVGFNGTRVVKARKGNSDTAKDRIEKGKIYYRPKGVKPQSRIAEPEDIENLVQDLVDEGVKEFGRKFALAFPGITTVPTTPMPADEFESERGDF